MGVPSIGRHWLESSIDKDSHEDRLIGRFPVSPNNLKRVQEGLWEVVNGKRGTARIAKIPGVEICGKTGTAQVFTRKTQSGLRKRIW